MLIAVAHNLASLHNVGAIFRTADGAGFSRIILSGYTGAPPDKRIAKVALGAEQHMPFETIEEFDDLLERLKDTHVVLLEQNAESVPPTDIPPISSDKDIALVVCDELYGAPEELIARADTIIELPMRGMKHSLNVSIAFGIAAYTLANHRHPFTKKELRERVALPVREGVLTKGRTRGETPQSH